MSDERKQTVRQEIISHLENGPLTVRDISQLVGLPSSDIYRKNCQAPKKKEYMWSPIIAWIADFNLRTGRHSKNQASVLGAKMAE